MSLEQRRKAAARCRLCGKILAVWTEHDGDVHPIGSGGTCPCGSSVFDVLS
ncbi:hypothetical protein [Natronobiforma cellulositropha]|uniref:hypothetical protein n=1 Tax=Natronobiforma cellulositropha TaxID=1679076 RepID=UPI0021D572AA|nr:hypothetical protein [Natronobiforma cellulositropha]